LSFLILVLLDMSFGVCLKIAANGLRLGDGLEIAVGQPGTNA